MSSTMPCKHVSTLLFSLFSNWRYTASSKFFDIQAPLISTEERMFPLYACCILSRHCCNGHSLLLSSCPQYKVWFESECVVVDVHQISTSQPVKRGKKEVKPTFFFFNFPLELTESRILLAAPADTRPRAPLISFCTVQLRTLFSARSLATLCLFTTSGLGPGKFPGFWGSMVFRNAPIPRKKSSNNTNKMTNTHVFNISLKMTANYFPWTNGR